MPKALNRGSSHRILIVCKDTGAANAFTTFMQNWTDTTADISIVCVEYAINVFKKNGIIPTSESLKDIGQRKVKKLLDEIQPDSILLGTSLDSWTERFFCKYACSLNIPCIAYIDWWSNFGARFSTPGTNDLAYLPDTIAVMDEDARLGCISDGIPKDMIRIVGNPYWDSLILKKDEIEKIRTMVRLKLGIPERTILVMTFSSNIRNLHLNLGYDEYDFWKALLPLQKISKKKTTIQWAIKPHPREKRHDIKKMLQQLNVDALLIEGYSAIETIAAADFIVGMCSSALFEAALLGKKVVSLQPGLRADKTGYLRIFDYLSIPKIVNAGEAKDVISRFINNEISFPDLTKVPLPIGKGTANSELQKLLLDNRKK